ncbi:efflux RND transporter periplasmic adaptor subunit [Bacteroides sp. 51]|uniref:efflux RND transporter periplasmic adaptor subunit n=1 Tax=Bacteroides sp. 51 TaxID=2302938 RepID=UPI0013D57D5C|nr:efflux RND transporter periplasmic adaptor subunit [Bacteroides sp. 51]NDV83406.1 efflux RND transporter periplasmic adaptor subunit [Bacteroides sp. 51]
MKIIKALILSILLIIVGYIIYKIAINNNGDTVKIVNAKRMTIESSLTISGVILPEKEIDIKSTISGVLEELYVKIGDSIKLGENIARIQYVKDPIEYERLLKSIEVSKIKYDNAQENFSRTQRLYDSQLIAEEEYRTEESNLNIIKSEYCSTVNELNMMKGFYKSNISNIITATNNGIILELPVKEGGSVMSRGTWSEGTTIAKISDLNSLIFVGNVIESDILLLKTGMPVNLSLVSNTNLQITGKIEFIAPKGTIQNGIAYFDVISSINVPDSVQMQIKAGCTASATTVLQRKENVLALEEQYFSFDYDSIYLEIKDTKGKFKKQFITTGISDGIFTEITSGIDEDDEIKVVD